MRINWSAVKLTTPESDKGRLYFSTEIEYPHHRPSVGGLCNVAKWFADRCSARTSLPICTSGCTPHPNLPARLGTTACTLWCVLRDQSATNPFAATRWALSATSPHNPMAPDPIESQDIAEALSLAHSED